MRVNPDCINSISDNKIDISSSWAWTDGLAYSPRYTETFSQPISMEATTLDFLRMKDAQTTITIRATSDPMSEVLWSGISYNIADDGNDTPGNPGGVQQQISTGCVAGVAPGAVYGAGTITIADTYANLCSTPDFTSPILTYWVTGGVFTLTDGTEQYLVIDYNQGVPVYRVENNKLAINDSSIILIRVCWRQGNNVHSIDSDCLGLGLANKIEASMISTTPYKKSLDGGLGISETSTPTARTVLVSGALVFAGSTPHPISAFNSSTDKLTFVRHVASVWTYSDVTVYNNSQYDNGTDVVALTAQKYTINWIYRSIGDISQCFFVLGNDQYATIAQAQTAPTIVVPLLLRDHCMLVGRIIVQQGASSGVVNNVSDTSFTSGTVTAHNDLSGLQGTGPEYYHLSLAQFTDLTDAGDSALHYHSGDRARANHTGTQALSTITGWTGWATKAFTNGSTTDVAEGTNLYFTTARVKAYGDTVYPQLTGSYSNPAWLTAIDASKITTGTIDLARLPALPSANTVVCTTIPAMTAGDQLLVAKGTVVIESTTGNTYRYSGVGSVLLNASYIQQSDMTPDWAVITNRPTLGSLAAKNTVTWTSDISNLPSQVGALTNATGHGSLKLGTIIASGWHGIEASDTCFTRLLLNDGNTTPAKGADIGFYRRASQGTGADYWVWRVDNSGALAIGSVGWSKLTGVPFKFGNYGSTYEGFWPSNNTIGDEYFALLWDKTSTNLFLNAPTSLIMQTMISGVRGTRLEITSTAATFSVPVTAPNITASTLLTAPLASITNFTARPNFNGITPWDGANLSFGTGNTNMARGDHNHSGVYQPLENQRLSTGNWPVFAGINTTGDIIGGGKGSFAGNLYGTKVVLSMAGWAIPTTSTTSTAGGGSGWYFSTPTQGYSIQTRNDAWNGVPVGAWLITDESASSPRLWGNASLLNVLTALNGTTATFSGSVKRGTSELWGRDDLIGTRNEHNHDGVYAKLNTVSAFDKITIASTSGTITIGYGSTTTGFGIECWGNNLISTAMGYLTIGDAAGSLNANGAQIRGGYISFPDAHTVNIGGATLTGTNNSIGMQSFVSVGNGEIAGTFKIGTKVPPTNVAYTIQATDQGKVVALSGQANLLPSAGIGSFFWCILAIRVNASLNTSASTSWFHRGIAVSAPQIVRGACVAVWDGGAWTVG